MFWKFKQENSKYSLNQRRVYQKADKSVQLWCKYTLRSRPPWELTSPRAAWPSLPLISCDVLASISVYVCCLSRQSYTQINKESLRQEQRMLGKEDWADVWCMYSQTFTVTASPTWESTNITHNASCSLPSSLLLLSHEHIHTSRSRSGVSYLTLVDRPCVVYHGLMGGEMFVSDCGIQKGVLWLFLGLL